MIFARLIGVLTIFILVAIIFELPGVLIMALLGGYKGLDLACLICILFITSIYLQKAARHCIEMNSYSIIFPSLIVFAVNIMLLLFVGLKMEFTH